MGRGAQGLGQHGRGAAGHLGGLRARRAGIRRPDARHQGRIVDERYAKWNEPKNKAMLDGKETLESIAKRALAEGLDPQPKSGRQERIEALLNSYI